jgi:D-alanine-D-alanine ligase
MSAFAKREQRTEITNAKEFGKVAVLFGGSSSEREVSLQTGKAVLVALQSLQVDAHAFDPAEHDIATFMSRGFDRAWIALHGAGGEDGTIQGALQWLGVPYTGSGVLASALAMDKIRSKHLFAATDIVTPEFRILRSRHDAAIALEQLGLPLIVKPSEQGSSVGMSKVFSQDELNDAFDLAAGFGDRILAERCIIGDEVTVAVLQGEALPSIRIETPRVFYDYRAKYESDNTVYHCPATNDPELEQKYADLAVAAFRELGCSGWGRVDFMTGADRQPQVLEVNTVPGMTSHSLVPMAAKASGLGFPELCWRILETSFSSEQVYAEQGGAR